MTKQLFPLSLVGFGIGDYLGRHAELFYAALNGVSFYSVYHDFSKTVTEKQMVDLAYQHGFGQTYSLLQQQREEQLRDLLPLVDSPTP